MKAGMLTDCRENQNHDTLILELCREEIAKTSGTKQKIAEKLGHTAILIQNVFDPGFARCSVLNSRFPHTMVVSVEK